MIEQAPCLLSSIHKSLHIHHEALETLLYRLFLRWRGEDAAAPLKM